MGFQRYSIVFMGFFEVFIAFQWVFNGFPPEKSSLWSSHGFTRCATAVRALRRLDFLWVKNTGYPKKPIGKGKNRPKPVGF